MMPPLCAIGCIWPRARTKARYRDIIYHRRHKYMNGAVATGLPWRIQRKQKFCKHSCLGRYHDPLGLTSTYSPWGVRCYCKNFDTHSRKRVYMLWHRQRWRGAAPAVVQVERCLCTEKLRSASSHQHQTERSLPRRTPITQAPRS